MTYLLKIAGDAMHHIALGNLLIIAKTISRHHLTAGSFRKHPINAVLMGTIPSE
jgi:hypothetical protein